MADVMAVARQQYTERQLLARRTILAVRKAWAQLDPSAIRATWAGMVGPEVYGIVTGAQYDAAAHAGQAQTAILSAQGVTTAAPWVLEPAAFADGAASDGRDLASLLELSNLVALKEIKAGKAAKAALLSGRRWLEMVVGTQVADAGRVAGGVAITTQHRVDGYYRVLSPPSCERCVVLAGKWFRWNAGFERHPKCDCTEIAASDGALDDHPHLWSPKKYFESISPAEQDRIFGKDGAQAIRDGADISQVVNARSGMRTASIGRGDVLITDTGTTKRGYFAYVQRAIDKQRGEQTTYTKTSIGQQGYVKNYVRRNVARPRLMPEQIYREANGDRDEAIRLLAGNGFLVQSVQADAARALTF